MYFIRLSRGKPKGATPLAGYPFDTFGTKHLLYLLGTALVTALVLWMGRANPDPRFRRRVALVLVVYSLGQELADDIIRVMDGTWTARNDLPFHLCSLAMLVSAYALATKRQLGFELAYYWGLAAASQAVLTPDPLPWTRELHVFWNFISHGGVVLNVLWLVAVEGMRVRKGSWLTVFVLTNLTLVPVALINRVLGSNYFFIREKPGGASPFLVGEWPWYILGFEVLALALFFVLYLPMRRKALAGRGY